MPFYDDHPIRVLMGRAGLSRVELARAAGITYGALDKVLMGMTATPHPEVVKVLAARTAVSPKMIRALVRQWNETPLLGKLAPRARAMLALTPEDLELFYGSFQQWREEFAENPTQFASLLRIPRATLVEFETGRRKIFPPTLAEAIRRELGVDEGYLQVLTALPPSDELRMPSVDATVMRMPRRPRQGSLPADDETEEV
jgi:transcriptional regulator with XRE-family HTH domain